MISSRIEGFAVAVLCGVLCSIPGCLALLDQPTDPAVAQAGAHYDTSIVAPTSGVYAVREGREFLGDSVVSRWVDTTLCFYSAKDAILLELHGGLNEGVLHFTGLCRAIRSGRSVPVDLTATWPAPKVLLTGTYDGSNAMSFEWSHPVPETTRLRYIVAHRGGGRNSDRLRRSENSLEMLRYAEILGANAVEVDVRLTRDLQAIVFHDETFSPRTMRGSYLLGSVRNFSLRDIQAYGELKYGEKVPTLREALQTIIRETSLELVWLDVKEPEAVPIVMAEQERALLEAREYRVGRPQIRLVMGIPTDDVLTAYRGSPRTKYPVLWENNPSLLDEIDSCVFWGPRWTSGVNRETVRDVKARGFGVLTWTVDVPEYMAQYVDMEPDGILTNYPSLLRGIVCTEGR